MFRTAILFSFILLLAACSGDEGGESEPDVDEIVEAVGDLAVVDQVAELTEGDSKRIPGRRDRLERAVLFYDTRLECREPGIECGAILEEWPDVDAARAQSEYIKALQAGGLGLGLGREYHYGKGAVLLRISGDLKPRQAEEYAAALRGEPSSH